MYSAPPPAYSDPVSVPPARRPSSETGSGRPRCGSGADSSHGSRCVFEEAFSSTEDLAGMMVREGPSQHSDAALDLERARTSLAELQQDSAALKRQLSSVQSFADSFRALPAVRGQSASLMGLASQQRGVDYRLAALRHTVAALQLDEAPGAEPSVSGVQAMLCELRAANAVLKAELDAKETGMKEMTAEHAAVEAQHRAEIMALLAASRRNMTALQEANAALRDRVRTAPRDASVNPLAELQRTLDAAREEHSALAAQYAAQLASLEEERDMAEADLETSWEAMAAQRAALSAAASHLNAHAPRDVQDAFTATVASLTWSDAGEFTQTMTTASEVAAPRSPVLPRAGRAGGRDRGRVHAVFIEKLRTVLEGAAAPGSPLPPAQQGSFAWRPAWEEAEADGAAAMPAAYDAIVAGVEGLAAAVAQALSEKAAVEAELAQQLEGRTAYLRRARAAAAEKHATERALQEARETAEALRARDRVREEEGKGVAARAAAQAEELAAAREGEGALRTALHAAQKALEEKHAALVELQRKHGALEAALREQEDGAAGAHKALFLEGFSSNSELVVKFAGSEDTSAAGLERAVVKDTVQELKAEVDALRAERVEARRVAAELEYTHSSLAAAHEAEQRAARDLTAEAAAHARTSEALAAAQAAANASEARTAAAEADAAQARRDATEHAARAAAKDAALAEAKEAATRQERELEQLWTQKAHAERQLAEEQAARARDVERMECELAAAEGDLRGTRGTVGALYDALAQANGQLQDHASTAIELEGELAALRAALAAAQGPPRD